LSFERAYGHNGNPKPPSLDVVAKPVGQATLKGRSRDLQLLAVAGKNAARLDVEMF